MINSKKIVFLAMMALSVILSGKLDAQDLPKLKNAAGIETGSFPNGIKYYLVNNKAASGYAGYALVQKGVVDVAKTRTELDSLDHLNGQKPYLFLSTRGVGYTKNGYAVHGDNYTMYRFEDVPVSDVASSDTTLMMLFDFCSLFQGDQAIIISGDIDAAAIKGKMSIFSMMVSPRKASPKDPAYAWVPDKESQVSVTSNHYDRLSAISVRYDTPRTAKKFLNTVQVLVTDMMYSELEMILKNRVLASLKSSGIPCADIRTRYKDAGAGAGDESFELTVYVAKENLKEATGLIAHAFANIDNKGVSVKELQDARDEYLSIICKEAENRVPTNSEYLDRCASSFLYGTSLAPASAARDFFLSKILPIEKDTEFFNKFVSAMLGPSENLSLSFDVPDGNADRDELMHTFKSAWEGLLYDQPPYRPHYGDTLALAGPSGKLKIKLDTAEPVSGGKQWIFSNGIKVIYKKVATPGQFRYAFLLRGGYSSVPGLEDGECAFVSDVLDYCDVAGKSCTDFNSMLRANGISMDKAISLTDMRITGSAPSSKVTLLLRSLLSLSKDRSINNEEYAYYMKCEDLRLEMNQYGRAGLLASVDSIMRPDYKYSPYKQISDLNAGIPDKCREFFDRQFEKVDDGIIAFVGDLDEEVLKSLLCKYLGGFKTSKVMAPKPNVTYDLRSGWSTYTREASVAEDKSLHVAMSSLIPITAERYFAFKIAQMEIRKRVVKALADKGYWVEVTDDCELYPQERLSVLVSCHQASLDGLPANVAQATPVDALAVVRAAVDGSVKDPVPQADFNLFKACLLKQFTSEMALPENIIDAVMTRYSDGKDIKSKYNAAINALTPAKVQEVLTSLGNGSKVEYVID